MGNLKFFRIKLRDRRTCCNITQTQVSKKTGISYQQFQKYDCACSKISAYILFKLANNANCTITVIAFCIFSLSKFFTIFYNIFCLYEIMNNIFSLISI